MSMFKRLLAEDRHQRGPLLNSQPKVPLVFPVTKFDSFQLADDQQIKQFYIAHIPTWWPFSRVHVLAPVYYRGWIDSSVTRQKTFNTAIAV